MLNYTPPLIHMRGSNRYLCSRSNSSVKGLKCFKLRNDINDNYLFLFKRKVTQRFNKLNNHINMLVITFRTSI